MAQKEYVDVAIDKSQMSTIENLTYQITTDCDCNIIPPDLSGFDILSKQPGQFSQTFNNNGAVSKKCVSTLTYVLRPKKKGKITIGTAKAKCKNGSKSSDPIKITVVDADEIHKANEGKASFYYKLVTDKESVYVGEPFRVSMYLYCEKLPEDINNIIRGDALGMTRHPIFNERDPGHVFRQTKQRVKGKDYHVIELTNDVCFADQPGKLDIGAYYGSAVEEYGFLDSKYMEGYTNSLEINVKKVPGEIPENYYGLAGDFEITHEISHTTVKANHAIDIWVRISGTGNFHVMQVPEFLFPKDSFLISEPEVDKSLTISEDGPTGTAEYHFVITPTKAGEYYVLPYSFAYFDWKAKKMKMVSTHEFTLNVQKGTGRTGPDLTDPGAPLAENDIHYIHTKSGKFFSDDDFLFGGLLHWLGVGAPVGFFFFLLIIRRRKAKRSKEDIKADEQRAVKRTAVKDIQNLKRLEGTDGINEMKRSMEEYFMTNLDVGRSALSKKYIVDALTAKEVKTELITLFSEIWDKIEMARFSPVTADNVSELYDKTEKLLIELNKQI